MEFHPNNWLGRWQNFESYITSTDPYLQLAWQEAEAAAAALPMFKSGAKHNRHTFVNCRYLQAARRMCYNKVDF